MGRAASFLIWAQTMYMATSNQQGDARRQGQQCRTQKQTSRRSVGDREKAVTTEVP